MKGSLACGKLVKFRVERGMTPVAAPTVTQLLDLGRSTIRVDRPGGLVLTKNWNEIHFFQISDALPRNRASVGHSAPRVA